MALTLWSDVERGLTNTELDTNFSELAAGGLAQTASDNRPTVKPSLNLDFTKGVLDPRITFTRASTATYFGADGLLKTAGVNEPRFEYDPVTRQPKGLLIEEQRTNIQTQSADVSYWCTNNSGASLALNQYTAPDGTLTADQVITLGAGSYFGQYGSGDLWGVLSTNGTIAYTGSIYLKDYGGNANAVSIQINAYSGTVVGVFNLVTGTATNGTIQPVGNGWYRCSVTSGLSTSALGTYRISSGGAYTLGVWGLQYEAGGFATSYIPTTTAQVTRSGDAASIVGNNFLSWYRPDEGTFLARATFYGFDGAGTYGVPIIGLAHPSFGDSFMQVLAYEPRRLLNFPYLNQIGQTFTSRDYLGIASFSIPTNNASAALGGVLTDPSRTVPVVGPLRDALGYARMGFLSTPRFSPNPTASGRTHIQRVAYYPKRLTNTQLQELTK